MIDAELEAIEACLDAAETAHARTLDALALAKTHALAAETRERALREALMTLADEAEAFAERTHHGAMDRGITAARAALAEPPEGGL